MAQNTVNYANNPTGPELLDNYLAKEQENILTSNSGIQRPSYAATGTFWIDTSVTPWLYKIYDGSNDVTLGLINPSTHNFIATGVDESNFVHKTGNESISGTKTFTETTSGANLVQSTSATATGSYVDFVQQINGSRRGTIRTTYNSDGSYSITLGCNGPDATVPTGVIVKRTSTTTTVTAPTPATSDNSTQIATTAFVKAQGYATSSSISNNYVNLSGTQTISGTKTFSAVAYGKASDANDSILTTVEEGTANNGWYVKFGNGWMIQQGIITGITSNTETTVTFPKSFKSSTSYTIVKNYQSNRQSEAADREISFYSMTSSTAKTFTASDDTNSFSWVAIGKWK